ncbi:condensin-2 complex subunit D3-L [Battus philenor]|uniref:condensin-2 complex subunit D3-L n=1 Tax=Battus philenor TaxID=42288 RepID=UPI0035CEDF0E
MMEVVDKLEQLRLDNVNEEWAQAIFDSEFLEFADLPPDFENVLDSYELKTVLIGIIESIDYWLDTDISEEKSWARLSQEIQHQKLLGILAYYIDYGNKNVINKEHRNNAVLASHLYYKLLSIPGYNAYNIYHSQLFVHTLSCLSFPKAMCDNEDNYFNSRELVKEVNLMLKTLKDFIVNLKRVMLTLQIRPTDMNFEDILGCLVDVTGGSFLNKLNIDKFELENLSASKHEIIDILICGKKGSPSSEALHFLFKCLLPKLVAASMDNRNANQLVRASYVKYSALLLSKYGKVALSGYIVLLQHLCYTLDGMEKAEVRTSRMSLVVGLMSLLPKKSYKEVIKWILKLSTTSKVSHRQIAIEILSKLLSNDSEDVQTNEALEKNNHKEPDPDIVDSDPVPTINENENETLDSNVMEPNVASGDNDTTENLNVQTEQEQEVIEEEMMGVLNQKAHTAPHKAIVRAVYERVHDASSALRMRALTILTECVDSAHPPTQDAIKDLNGQSEVPRLVAVAARCVCDERAVVRRAAAALVHRLLANAQRHTPNDLAILVGMCRDASIIVRTTAITGLSELVMQQPSEALLDAFLTGPMHQLSDPEAKIQEQVVTQIQQILFERLRVYVDGEQEDHLPWLFLGAIVRHNMRRHLQKACTLLLKSSQCINNRVVEVLSTHMGAVSDARDLQCLTLLTSIARHVDYSDLAFLLQYYYNFDKDTEKRDVRLLALTLEMLTLWSRWLTDTDREALRTNLIRRLASASNPVNDGCRTACASLAAHLDPENLQWATDLMQIAERRAVSEEGVADCLLAADLSLVAPVPPSADLLRLLLAPLGNPPPEMEGRALGVRVAGAGRVCVRSRAAAAVAAPTLAALLRDHAAPLPARLNALLALTDICVRFTCIVEPLLDSICECVNAETAPPLRRAAARALTRLLLAGYLRLRTPLYFRYCALIADEDHDVREPAEYYVSSCLTTDAIYHHFVDCVLHYNNEGENISFDARQLIYDVMLQRLSLVQKLNVQCRLARQVLQHAADLTDEGDGELPPSLNAALLDTITLLCGPRMRLPKKPQNTGETADIDDLQERVTTNIVSHKMKRTVAEVLVPAVLRLYARLRSRGGQLAAYLVRIATDLLADYRQEIEELIENDEELVERIRHFQQTIGLESSFGNARNLVTTSAPMDPETPRQPRKRHARTTDSHRKRALKL